MIKKTNALEKMGVKKISEHTVFYKVSFEKKETICIYVENFQSQTDFENIVYDYISN